jgi:polysaccharide biosynthesis protein PslG
MICVLALAGALATLPSQAAAHGPKAGVVSSSAPNKPPSQQEFAMMRSGGVNSVRVLVFWPTAQPSDSAPFNWTPTDAIVGNAATQGMLALPFITGSPRWLDGCSDPVAKCQKRPPLESASQRAAWKRFLAALVARYGPRGSFWADNPSLPYLPIRSWEIWNEENLPNFAGGGPGAAKGGPRLYARLLDISAHAIRLQNPGAQIVIGGLSPGPALNGQPVKFLQRLYRIRGARKDFDVVAVHPYVRSLAQVARLMDAMARAVRKAHDHVPLWVTEIGWSSSSGHGRGRILKKGPQGQARMVRRSYEMFTKNMHRWNLERVFYFAWRDLSSFDGGDPHSWISTAGLRHWDLTPKPAWTALTKAIKESR